MVCKYESHFENLPYTILLNQFTIKKFDDFVHPNIYRCEKIAKLNVEVFEKCFHISKLGASELYIDLVHKLFWGGCGTVAA